MIVVLEHLVNFDFISFTPFSPLLLYNRYGLHGAFSALAHI